MKEAIAAEKMMPLLYEVSDWWYWEKDGLFYFDKNEHPKLMRK